jgi:hypothetical protein
VAATFTLFATRTSHAADILAEWLGEAYTGVIHCDRARMYWPFGRLRWCWAHTIRKNPCNARGTAEQGIKEGKNAVKWTKLSCRRFKDNAARLQLFALAYNPNRSQVTPNL